MTVTRTTFLARFPEFGEQTTSVVDGALAEAERSTPASVWLEAERRDDAVNHLAAHLLAVRTMQIGAQTGSPSGAALGADLMATLYGQERKRMEGQLPVCGFVLTQS